MFSVPAVAGDSVFVGSCAGVFYALNCRGELASFQVSDGAPKWKVNLKGCIRSVGDSGDTLFAGVQEGTVYALSY